MTGSAKHTPGPWIANLHHEKRDGGRFHVFVTTSGAAPIACVPTGVEGYGREEGRANARLIAAAPDHALIGWAMCVGAGRWEPYGDGRGEFCMNGIRHSTKLDDFGVPVVTPSLRAALAKAKGQPS